MRPGQLVCAVLTALVLLAGGCAGGEGGGGGDGNGGGGGNGSGGGGSGGGGGGGNGGGGDGDGESEFAVDTELDLGQAFAEDPMFDGALGFVTVNVRTDRGGGLNAQVPITFRLANSGQANLEDVAITIRFTVLPAEDPEDPPVPAPDDPALELAPQTTAGTCAAEDTTSTGTAIACSIGTLASGAEATITMTSPQWFRFSIRMELRTRGP
jgi:hypothetical protein